MSARLSLDEMRAQRDELTREIEAREVEAELDARVASMAEAYEGAYEELVSKVTAWARDCYGLTLMAERRADYDLISFVAGAGRIDITVHRCSVRFGFPPEVVTIRDVETGLYVEFAEAVPPPNAIIFLVNALIDGRRWRK